MTREKFELDEITKDLIQHSRSGQGMTPSQMVERAERALDDRIDVFEREAMATLAATESAPLADVLGAAESLRAASLLYRYDLLGVLADSLVLWCSDHVGDPRLNRAIVAHRDAMRTVLAARMRGDRPAEHKVLMAGLEATLRDG